MHIPKTVSLGGAKGGGGEILGSKVALQKSEI